MSNKQVEISKQIEQAEQEARTVAHMAQAGANAERRAESMASLIVKQVLACTISDNQSVMDLADLSDSIYDFIREGMHITLGMKSMKALSEHFGRDGIVNSESNMRDCRDLGFVRSSTPEGCIEPTSTQAGRILKSGLKVGADHEENPTLLIRLRLFSELSPKYGEIKGAKLAVEGSVTNAKAEDIEASADADEATAKAPKSDAEKAEIQLANFITAVQKLNDADGRAMVKSAKAQLTLSNLEFTGK